MRACVFLACKVDNYRGGTGGEFVAVEKHTKIEIQDHVSPAVFVGFLT